MSQSERTRAARIRAKATGRNYQKALEAVDGEPTPAQRTFEGAFFSSLRQLWYFPSTTPSLVSGIVSVEPKEESLTVRFGHGSNPRDLRNALLPTFVEDSNDRELSGGGIADIAGIPGLRIRPHRTGTRLFRPGITAEIVVEGIHATDLEFTPEELVWSAGAGHPNDWTSEELAFANKYPKAAGLAIESVVLRRVGLLRAAGAWGVDSWRTAGRIGTTVEIAFQQVVTPELAEGFMGEFMSKHLHPKLVLEHYERPRHGSAALIDLSLPGTDQSVQLRLVRFRRPNGHAS